jgi:hypothetical protein
MAGGGVGEAALIGAAFGGGKALLTGEDPLKAALMGGITGGAMAGVTNAIPGMDKLIGGSSGAAGGAGGGAGAAGGGAGAAAKDGIASSIQGTIQDGVIQGANTGLNVAGAGGMGSQGITAYNGAVAPNFAPIGNTASINSGIAGIPVNQPVPQGIVEAAPVATVNPELVNTVTAQPVESTGQALSNNSANNIFGDKGFDVRDYTSPGTLLDKGANWWANQGLGGQAMYAGLGGAGYGAYQQSQEKPEMPKEEDDEENDSLYKFDKDKFTAYEAPRPDPYPQANYTNYYQYAKEGGVMDSYAEGGITALSSGMSGNTGYPQSQINQTHYASPSQMPTSAAMVNTDYGQMPDSYAGSPLGMAEGGIARFFPGGVTKPNPNQVFYDAKTGQYYTQTSPTDLNSFTSRGREASRKYISNPFANEQPTPEAPVANIYTPTYKEQAPARTYTGPQGGMAPNYSLSNSMPLLARTNPAAAQAVTGMAGGGIAGYNLGGYASGGNPRLLKGPGDGMSDNIPATIGGRQPARLADGEFVVPADVVSHLGNGSTDAGAKHLYTMMDRVRKARTGRKAQGKQIKPAKFVPA